ncbi:TPA: NEAT domain-containing protein, partial [Bacillus mobilis]|nr:NEAT domain-containing protein [Bacillus mobilis]
MNRYLKIVVAMCLMIFTFISTLQPLAVQAATKLADGEYSIGFQVIKDTSDEISKMNDYVISPATLKVKDGKQKVSFTLKNSEWITKFTTEKDGQFVDVNVLGENKEKNTRVVEFDVVDVANLLNGKVKVDIDAMDYHHIFDVRIKFDSSSITLIKAEKPNEKEDPANKPDPNEKPDPSQKPDQKPDSDQQPNSNTINDGNYSIPFKVLKDKTDEESRMKDKLISPAVLKVENGKKKATVTLTDNASIKNFQTEKDGSFVDAKVISENKEKNTRVVEFEVDNLSKKLNTKVFIEVASQNYKQTHELQLQFNQEKLESIKDEEKQPEVEKPTIETIKDGDYSIPFKVLKDKTDEESRMKENIISPAVLKVENGKKKAVVTLKDNASIKNFQTEKDGSFVDAKVVSEDKEKNTRVVEFEVDNLSKKLNTKVFIEVASRNYKQTHELQLQFDQEKLEPIKNEEKQPDGDKKPEVEKPDVDTMKDGEYSINFKALKDQSEEISMMNTYTKSPGVLKVKDGKKYVSFTLTNSAWITKFEFEKNGSFVDASVLSEDKKADTRVVEVAVDDLSKKLNAKVKVDIDSMNYHHFYDIQFAFDKGSIKPLDNQGGK